MKDYLRINTNMRFDELTDKAKQRAKDLLIEQICQGNIPPNVRFNNLGYVTQWSVIEYCPQAHV